MEFESLLIPAMMVFPLLGGILLLLVPRHHLSTICYGTFFTTFITFLLSMTAAGTFAWSRSGEVQLVYNVAWVPAFGLRLAGGADALSMWFILLTSFLMPLVMLESFTHLRERTGERAKEFFFWLLWAESAMIGAFTATDLLYFYVCFEFTLIPLFFLIGVFGSTNRLQAAGMYFLYSFTGSMLMLAGILYLAWHNASLPSQHGMMAGQWTFDFAALTHASSTLSLTQQGWILIALLCGFAVKVPMWPVHTWLPLAHTEAPTAGSVDLAAVLLKLGTYGILRFALPVTPEAVVAFAPWIGGLAVVGIVYAALVCWVQTDVKKLIAYSSVSHMGFCILGLFAINDISVGGSVFYMLAHGISTGALFLTVGMLYTRFHTRDMNDFSGLAKVMPLWSFFLVFFCLASVGLPGLNGFIGEFLTLMGTFQAGDVLGWPFALTGGLALIFAAMYLLYLVGRVVWGEAKVPAFKGEIIETHDLTPKEIWTLAPLAVICLLTGLYPTPILRTVESAIQPILAPARAVADRREGIDSASEVVSLPTADWADEQAAAMKLTLQEPASQ